MNIKNVPALNILLAAMLLVSVSCGDSNSNNPPPESDSTDTAEISKSRLDELGEKDFNGEVFRILDANGSPGIHINIPSEESSGDIINDAIFVRDRKINELYNVSIEYQQIPDINVGANTLKNSVLSDEKYYNAIFSTISGGSLGTLATEGILADLSNMEYLSLESEWWSPLIYESCRIGDRLYYTCGDIAPSIYCAPACYYANEKLLGDYNISSEELYDKVEAGEFTIDYLKSLAFELTRDLNNDDSLKVEDDFFGILNETNPLTAYAFMTGAGVKFISIDSSGNAQCDVLNNNTISVIEKLASTLSNAKYSNNQSLHDAFMSDRAVFMMHYVSSAYTRYRDMKSDFIILPIPKYDTNQANYHSLVNTWSNSFCGVPANQTSEFTGFILEALAYESHMSIRPLSYDVAFKNKGARNERNAAMLDLIFSTLYLDFTTFMSFGGIDSIVNNAVFKGADFSSGYTSIQNKINDEIAEFSRAWKQE